MGQTTHSIEHKETVISPVDVNDSPTVLAYRVGQLEKALIENTQAQKDGIEKLGTKMDKFVSEFATKIELNEVKEQLQKEIEEVKAPVWKVAGVIIVLFIGAVAALVFKQ
jgi:hypothetical protein